MRRIHRGTRRARGEGGFTAVWVALGLVVLMLFAALAIDGGQAYSSRRQSQNASDAGAMAGVGQLAKIKFPAPGDTPPASTAIAEGVLQQARNSGADTSAGGVQCYVITFDKTRIGGDRCLNGAAQTVSPADLDLALGVEVLARQTKETYFARVIGIDDTEASTSARAMIQSYVGQQGAPFTTCGSLGDDPDSNDILEFVDGVYKVKSSALLRYYALQGPQLPQCDESGSAEFKGKLVDSYVVLNTPQEIVTGNGQSAAVEDAVSGVTPCTPQQIASGEFNGCGLPIPIASEMGGGSGGGTEVILRIWTVWKVWGSGTGNFSFDDVGEDGLGNGCAEPFNGPENVITGQLKYCGQLLGPTTLTSGQGDPNAPPTTGSAIVLKLVS